MPRCNGVEATRLMRDRAPGVAVVVLTTYADDRSVIAALRAGARGDLTKDACAAEISRPAAGGERPGGHRPGGPAPLVEAIAREPAHRPGRAGARRRAAARRADAAGGGGADADRRRAVQREIAARLVVSEATVKSHVNHLLAKTGARDRAQAVGYAYQRGLLRQR